MKRAGVGGLSAVCRDAGTSRAATQTDPRALVGVKRHCLLELQWQGGNGKFRHVALSPRGLGWAMGTFGVVVLFVLAVVGAFSVGTNRALAHLSVAGASPGGSNRALAHFDVDTVLRENTELKARQDALRERAFDLAEQLYGRVEQGRRMLGTAGIPGHSRESQCPRPPGRDAGDDAILAWLSEQGTRLESIGNELTADRVEMGVKQASALVPVSGGWATVRGELALYMADMGPARR